MVKKPFNLGLGILCGMCFLISLSNHKDVFVLIISALATALNITAAFM